MAQQKTNTTKVSDQPAGIDFNFDTFDADATAVPYQVHIGGRRIEFADPGFLDWQTLMKSLQNPYAFMKLTVEDDEDRAFFLAQTVQQRKFTPFMRAYLSRYGMTADAGVLAD